MRSTFKAALCLMLTSIGCSALAEPSSAAELLTVGSDAPALDVEHWIHKDQDKLPPVTKFEPGKIYVVEFWATWCGPCLASMPHLAELQTKLADKGVRIISISDEDLPTVEEFLDREVRQGPGAASAEDAEGKKENKAQTYRELTSAYSLTTDPDQSSYRDYMEAAAQNGIPTAFIVGKDAKVEWIGHPMEMDEPLNAVVEGTWDREAFAAELKAQQEAEKAMQDIFALLQKQEFDAAIEKIDAALAGASDNLSLNLLKLQIYIATEKTDAAAKHLKQIFAEVSDTPEVVNMVAWNIYEMASQGRVTKGPLIDEALAAGEKTLKSIKDEDKASMLDTLAHLHFANDDLDKALELETAAVKLAGDRDREFIEGFLAELKELKQDQASAEQEGAKKEGAEKEGAEKEGAEKEGAEKKRS